MRRKPGSRRASLRVLAGLGLATGLAAPGHGQVLLQQNFPTVNLGFQSDYLRRGSGYGQLPETTNQAATATGVTVLTRPHPEYDPQGARYRDITARADATEGIGYDSNPLGFSSSRGSGFVASQAEISVANDRERSGIAAGMSVSDLQYFDLSQVNHTDWTATVSGHYDVERGRIDAGYTHLNLNILPTAIDTIGQNAVVPYTDDLFQLRYAVPLGRFTVIPQASYSIYRFGTSLGLGGITSAAGNVFNETVNNRNELTVGTTVEYEFAPGRNAVLVARGTKAGFTNNAIGSPSQDYGDVQVLGGLDIQTQGKFRYRALAGYEERSYHDSRLRQQSTPIFEAQVIWTPTQLTTLTATLSRTIEYSLDGTATNFIYTTARLQADHEIRRNIILTGFGQFQNASFQRSGSENLYDAGLNLTYKLNRHVSLLGSYEYLYRDSARFTNYRENVVLLNVRLDL